MAEVQVQKSWRLHWEADIRKPEPRAVGVNRFDAPAGEYSVTYVNSDKYAAFAEVYGDERAIAPNQSERLLSTVQMTRPLRVVDLDNAETLAAHSLDLRISADPDYKRTMRWGKAFHKWYREADGIRYLGRHAAKHLNFCLFLDRCGDAIDFEVKGKLGESRSLVMKAADAYNLAPRLFESRDRSTPL